MRKLPFVLPALLAALLPLGAEPFLPLPRWWEPAGLEFFRDAYPDIEIHSEYDRAASDWRIRISVPQADGSARHETLWWCGSRLLPEEQLSARQDFRPMLYSYPDAVPDPAGFSDEFIESIRERTSSESRKNGPASPPYFFDAVYDCATQAAAESHIKRVDFLNRSVNVHEKLEAPLKRVSERILALAGEDEEIRQFLETLVRTDGFQWRTVRDTSARSFHSIGLAVDILPRGYYQRIIYWNWQKQIDPEGWMLTPLSKRWTPPEQVIRIFEEEGFIWGGKWMVWDNMHFEYHPELILFNARRTPPAP
ncbi:MAG: M15 family metallopeptidase [Treponemataceae bacterium]|nr:M15 family metallopeptidase [Treponemataceae bacterium]